MDADLEKLISDSIEEGSEAPGPDLEASLAEDAEATSRFEEWKLLERRLRSWGFEQPPREYWRSFVPRLTGRLGTMDEPEVDPLEPPAPDEGEPEPEVPEEPEAEQDPLAGLAGLVGPSTLPPVSGFRDGPAVVDDSSDSVIDIGALRRGSSAPPPAAASEEPAAAVAAASSRPSGEAPATPAPLVARQEERKSSSIYYVVAVLVVALGVAGYFAFRGPGEGGERLAEAPGGGSATAEPSAAPPAVAPQDETGAPMAAAPTGPVGEEGVGEEGVGEEGVGEEGVGEEAGTGAHAAGRRGKARPLRPAGGGGGAAAPSAPPAAEGPSGEGPEPSPPAAPSKAEKSGSASLDDLLSGATKGSKAGGTSKAGGSDIVASAVGGGGDDLPDQPSRSQVRRAMGSVAGQVYACRAMVESTVRVNATVTVSSAGAVTSARASGGPDPVNSCVERAVRGARFPRFRQPTFTVTYPFVLSPPEE